MKIVSLLASATEIVDALGLNGRLVAISHECDYPPSVLGLPRASRPRFDPEGLTSGEIDRAVRRAMAEHGSVYEIDEELLERLRPDLILTQAVCEVCAVPAGGVAAALERRGLEATVLSLDSHTVGEILDAIHAVGRAAGDEPSAVALVASLRTRLDRVAAAVTDARSPRVMAIEWLDPPFVPGHWVPEMIDLAGGLNLLGGVGRPSREVAWGELESMDPDILVIMPCGYGIDAAEMDAHAHADRLAAIAPRAIAAGRAVVVDASAYFNRSGPRFVTGVEILGSLLHPERCGPADPAHARVWAPAGAEARSLSE